MGKSRSSLARRRMARNRDRGHASEVVDRHKFEHSLPQPLQQPETHAYPGVLQLLRTEDESYPKVGELYWGVRGRRRGPGCVGLPQPTDRTVSDPSSTKETATGANTMGHLSYHLQQGAVFLDLGTTSSYRRTDSLAILNTQDALAIFNNWTGLNPNTTSHWRLRFVDNQGRTFTRAHLYRGAQTLGAPPPRRTPPRPGSYAWCLPRTPSV